MIRKGGPGSRGAKFEVSKNGKVQYFHHGNTQHSSGHGLAHPNLLAIKSFNKPVVKPILTIKTAKGVDNKDKSPLSKLTRLAKPSPVPKPNKSVNHHIAKKHSNFLIKRG